MHNAADEAGRRGGLENGEDGGGGERGGERVGYRTKGEKDCWIGREGGYAGEGCAGEWILASCERWNMENLQFEKLAEIGLALLRLLLRRNRKREDDESGEEEG